MTRVCTEHTSQPSDFRTSLRPRGDGGNEDSSNNYNPMDNHAHISRFEAMKLMLAFDLGLASLAPVLLAVSLAL